MTSERKLVAKEQGDAKAANLSDEIIYRIEIPANRYDLLTTEGLVRAVKAYLHKGLPSVCVTVPGPISVTVKPSVRLFLCKDFTNHTLSYHNIRPRAYVPLLLAQSSVISK